MTLAPGASRILNLRKHGNRPGDDIVVSVIGPKPVMWLVEADLDTDYDWMWVIDLNVWVVADGTTDPAKLRRLLKALRNQRPRVLHLWMDDSKAGYDVFFFPKVETIRKPAAEWEWVMEIHPLLPWQNVELALMFQGAEEEEPIEEEQW